MDRMIRMIINMVMRRVINRGVNAGIDRVARGRTNASDTTPDQKASIQQNQRRAKQAMRTARRFTRF